jgi:hypothetical protein
VHIFNFLFHSRITAKNTYFKSLVVQKAEKSSFKDAKAVLEWLKNS